MSDFRIFLLIAALGFLSGSLVFFINNKVTTAVVLLFVATLALFIFAALLDPFLNMWDERFHALVAKNMLNHPLKPTLYDNPVITMAYDRWDRSVTWLHKQPLFLWQIAASYKIFGINELAVRFPSAMLCSLLVPISYRSGKILVNRNTGYYTALFVTSSFFLIELISGHKGVDHNDAVFFFYVSASIWAWLEFIDTGKKYWLVLIGVFSGFAILTKWLVGLIVYPGWALYIFTGKKTRSGKAAYLNIAVSLMVTCFVALPWQLWILKWHPAEAMFEYRYNTDHFFKVIEGNDGPWWYYLGNLQNLYGFLSPIIIPAGLILLFKKIKKGTNVKIAMAAFPIIIYLFYSLAETKMTGFPFVISMPIFIGMACFVDVITGKISGLKLSPHLSRIAALFLLILLLGFNVRAGELMRKHSLEDTEDKCPAILVQNKKIFLNYKAVLPSNTVLFNLKGRSYIDCMFYTGFPAYNFLPSENQYNELKNRGKYHIFIVNILQKDCPDYLRNDPSVTVLNDTVLCCD